MGDANEIIEEYKGSMSSKVVYGDVKKAIGTWSMQKQRCQNHKCAQSKNYMGKGIKVEYTARQFVAWYLREIDKYGGIKPSVGRIDHDKNYSLDNIRIESRGENSREGAQRNKCSLAFSKRVALHSKKTNEAIAVFPSSRECARFLGVAHIGILNACKSKVPMNTRKFSWYYRFAT